MNKIKKLTSPLVVYVLCVGLAGFLWRNPFILTLCYMAVSIAVLVKWHSKKEIFYFIAGLTLGSLGELFAVYCGAWEYSRPLFLIPIWLPFAWGIAVVVIIKLCETLIAEKL